MTCINAQMRRGLKRVMNLDSDFACVKRRSVRYNERGAAVADGEESVHFVRCRIGNERAGIWGNGLWTGGAVVDAAPCVFAEPYADLKEGDRLEWRGKVYETGVVTYPSLGGQAVSLQAKLLEIKDVDA